MRSDSRRPGDLSFSGTHPSGRAGTRPTGRAGSRPGGAPGPSIGGGGTSDGGGGLRRLLGCGAIAIPAALATLGLGAVMALSACQPRTPADTPRPLMSGRQAPAGDGS